MDPHLQRLQKEIAAAVEGLSPEQLSQHSPGKWCAGEVLEHLYLTYTGTVKGLSGSQKQASAWLQPKAGRSEADPDRGGIRIPAFRPRRPSSSASARIAAGEVRAEIGPKIAEMDESIARCEERFGSRRKLLDHPILGPLTAAQWRKFHLVHGLHHVKQIKRLRELAIEE